MSSDIILITLAVVLAIALIIFLVARNKKDRKELITPDDASALEERKRDQEREKDQL